MTKEQKIINFNKRTKLIRIHEKNLTIVDNGGCENKLKEVKEDIIYLKSYIKELEEAIEIIKN